MKIEYIELAEAPKYDISHLRKAPTYISREQPVVRENGEYAYMHFLKCDFKTLLMTAGDTYGEHNPTMSQLKKIMLVKQGAEMIKEDYNCILQGIVVHPTNTYDNKVN